MASLDDTLGPGSAVGGYVVERLLGRGGMGEVYLAHDPVERRPVALKLLPREAADDLKRQERLQFEGRVAQTLRHPNICSVYEVGEDGGRVFLAMEYVEGQTLDEYSRLERIPVDRVIDIAVQVAAALGEARRHHVVHRDLKGANILVEPSGHVKVLDFGLARLVRPDSGRVLHLVPRQTDPGAVVGTADFMSPEQALGRHLDHRSDLFSFGVILYELLTGHLPFSGRTKMELFGAILNAEPAPIARANPDVPEQLVAIVQRLLHKDANQRYQSAGDVLADLRAIRSGWRARRAVRRGVWLPRLAGTAAGLLLAVCGIYPTVFALCRASERLVLASTDRPSSVWAGRGDADDLRSVAPVESPSFVWVGDDGHLFYVSSRSTGSPALWQLSPGSRERTMIAPDASEVAVARRHDEVFYTVKDGRPGLYRSAADGTRTTLVIGGTVVHPIAIHDGRSVMFGRQRQDGTYGIWAAPLEGGDAYQVSALQVGAPPYVSPDGRRVAFPDRMGVVVCDLPTCDHRVQLPIAELLGWSHDSQALAHIGPPRGANVWMTRVSDGAPRQVTRFTDRAVSSASWSPNGRRFAVTRVTTLADLDIFRSIR